MHGQVYIVGQHHVKGKGIGAVRARREAGWRLRPWVKACILLDDPDFTGYSFVAEQATGAFGSPRMPWHIDGARPTKRATFAAATVPDDAHAVVVPWFLWPYVKIIGDPFCEPAGDLAAMRKQFEALMPTGREWWFTEVDLHG